jgi:hypothetical protein
MKYKEIDFNSELEIIAASEDMRIVSARRKYEVVLPVFNQG